MKYKELLTIARNNPNCCSIDKFTKMSANKREDDPKVTVNIDKE